MAEQPARSGECSEVQSCAHSVVCPVFIEVDPAASGHDDPEAGLAALLAVFPGGDRAVLAGRTGDSGQLLDLLVPAVGASADRILALPAHSQLAGPGVAVGHPAAVRIDSPAVAVEEVSAAWCAAVPVSGAVAIVRGYPVVGRSCPADPGPPVARAVGGPADRPSPGGRGADRSARIEPVVAGPVRLAAVPAVAARVAWRADHLRSGRTDFAAVPAVAVEGGSVVATAVASVWAGPVGGISVLGVQNRDPPAVDHTVPAVRTADWPADRGFGCPAFAALVRVDLSARAGRPLHQAGRANRARCTPPSTVDKSVSWVNQVSGALH